MPEGMAVSHRSFPATNDGRKGVAFLLASYLSAMVVFGVLTTSTIFQPLEMRWLDMQFKLLRAMGHALPNDDIRIVGIDDEDLRVFGVPLALMHTQLGDYFHAMAVARPKALGVDIVLPPHSYDTLRPGLDAALARGIVTAKQKVPLVFAVGIQSDGTVRPLHPLFASLATSAGLGFALINYDADGRIRHFNERFDAGTEPVPTLAGQIVRALNLPVGVGTINYLVGDRFQYVPMRTVLAWHAARADDELQNHFSGKVVLLGSVLPHDDLHRTSLPLAAWTDDPDRSHGLLVHGQLLRSLLTNSMIESLPVGVTTGLLALAALTVLLKPGLASSGFVLILLVGILSVSLWLIIAGWALPSAGLVSMTLGGYASRAAREVYLSLRERYRLRSAFRGFVSPAVMKDILLGRLQPTLGGKKTELCVLFSDIRGFTTLSENMEALAVTEFLNRYFEHMTSIIHARGGTLDKFIGDGIMCFFGSPQTLDDPCEAALGAAREMIEALRNFNVEQEARGEPRIAIGIGMHFGPAIVGFVGARERNDYSAIGDTVNTASRIEGLTKDSGFPVLVSDAVHARLRNRDGLVRIGIKPVKGRSDILVFGWRPPNAGQGRSCGS